MKKKIIISISVFLIILSLLFVYLSKNSCKKEDTSVCKLKIKEYTMKLSVAYSPKKQEQGLMFIEHLNKNEGMIFVYDREKYMSFWMKNTLIPLSIAFVRYNGEIKDIYKMYPEPYASDYDLTRYNSSSPVLFAIEMPIDWFEQRKIKVGDYIKIPKELR